MSGSGDPTILPSGGGNTSQQVPGTSNATLNPQTPASSNATTTLTQTGNVDTRMQAMDQKMDQLMTMFWAMMAQMSTAMGMPPPRTYVASSPAYAQSISAMPIEQAALPLAPDPDDQDTQTTDLAQTNTIHALFPSNSLVVNPAGLHPPLSRTSSKGIVEAFPTTLLAMSDMDPPADPPVDVRWPDDEGDDNDSKEDSSIISETAESTDGNSDSCGNNNSEDHSGDDFEEDHTDDPESDE